MRESQDRSRSPRRDRREHHDRHRHRDSRRSVSPGRHDSRRSDRHHERSSDDKSKRHSSRRHRSHTHDKQPVASVALPFSARPLSKADLPVFEALFAEYLDLQKQINIDDLDDRELKGRWKSFISKWNAGELAEGWYDPEMFSRIAARGPPPPREPSPPRPAPQSDPSDRGDGDAGSDDEDYGPVLPQSHRSRAAGAAIPSRQDLSLRDELVAEARLEDVAALRAARKADRTLQKERLDDVAPRAEAGTRERRLEKKQLLNEKLRGFRDRSPGGGMADAATEAEVMGGGDSLEEYKRAKANEQRRKTEREIRREEMERARREEIEERRRAYQEKEDGTVAMLRELAKQRFG